jgi:hypothetical protein
MNYSLAYGRRPRSLPGPPRHNGGSRDLMDRYFRQFRRCRDYLRQVVAWPGGTATPGRSSAAADIFPTSLLTTAAQGNGRADGAEYPIRARRPTSSVAVPASMEIRRSGLRLRMLSRCTGATLPGCAGEQAPTTWSPGPLQRCLTCAGGSMGAAAGPTQPTKTAKGRRQRPSHVPRQSQARLTRWPRSHMLIGAL